MTTPAMVALTEDEAAVLRTHVTAIREARHRLRLAELRGEVRVRERAEVHGFDPDVAWQLDDVAPVLRPAPRT